MLVPPIWGRKRRRRRNASSPSLILALITVACRSLGDAQLPDSRRIVASSSSHTSDISDTCGWHLPLYRRAKLGSRSRDKATWVERESHRLHFKYNQDGVHEAIRRRTSDPVQRSDALHARQVSATFTGLPPDRVSVASRSTSSLLPSTTGTLLRGVSDGRGGVIGLERTINFQADLEYYTRIRIGTPPQEFDVILDSGSSDLWLASSNCTTANGCPEGVRSFSVMNSSTVQRSDDAFSIRYGTGTATGSLFTDNVTLAGYTLNQTFALVDSITSDLLGKDISGLLGLGFQTLASSGVKPFWEALVSNVSTPLAFPGFSFAFTRFANITNASEIEPGGLFTLGTLNSSLYTGVLNFVPVPVNLESYWLVQLDALHVEAQSGDVKNSFAVELKGETTQNVAIDTGTTLIGGPAQQVRQLYSGIPGSMAATGNFAGYYTYPCNATVHMTLMFGGVNYSMSAEDFNLGPFGSNTTCLGAVFELNLSGASRQLISWVIGDSFLKNVFTAFRYSPPAVGFAQLSSAFNTTGNASINVNGPLFNRGGLNSTEAPLPNTSRGSSSPTAADQNSPSNISQLPSISRGNHHIVDGYRWMVLFICYSLTVATGLWVIT